MSVRDWFRTYREPPVCPEAGDSPKEWRQDAKPPRAVNLNADFVIKALLLHSGVYHASEERRMAKDQLRTDGASEAPLIISSFMLFSDFQYQELHVHNLTYAGNNKRMEDMSTLRWGIKLF